MKVSVNAVWDETLAFIRAERALIVPLVLGTLYLCDLLVLSTMAILPQAWVLATIIASLWSLVGEFALIDLVLEPRRSVREALGLGIRRLPPAIGICLVAGVAIMLLAAPLFYSIAKAGYGTPAALEQLSASQAEMMKLAAALPNWANLYSTLLLLVSVVVFMRLLLWKAALTLGGNAVEAIKRSWELTRGRFLQLLGLTLLAVIVMKLTVWALQLALGSIFLLIGQAFGSAFTAQLVPALILSLVTTAFQVLIILFLAHYYRRALV